MKKVLAFVLGLSVLLAAGCQQEKTTVEKWYKGNLHTHSFWSDGNDFPEMIMDWYQQKGYHFLALSEHNTLQEGEKWIGMAADTLYRQAFQRYVDRFGEEWVESNEEEGALRIRLKTLEEYRGLFEIKDSFLILPSEEITDRFEDKHLHLNATNIQELIEPQRGESVVQVLQRNLDAVWAQRERTGEPMIVHINHPNFHYSISVADMIALEGERFFEVFNGHPEVHNQGDSAHVGMEEMWDQVNIAYLAAGKDLLYGLGTDDSHHYHRQGRTWSNAGRGWVMVKAEALTPEALIDALEAGDFYASTGVILHSLSFEDGELRVEVKPEVDVEYVIEFIGCNQGDQATRVLHRVASHTASYPVTPEHLFVRARITSDKKHANPIEQLDYEMAWTQPVLPTSAD